jgi:predicted nucleic acid-binding Zn ribbon protein
MTWHPAPDPDRDPSERVRDAIHRFLNRGGHGEIALLSRVNDVWESAVGAHVASHVRPSSIANKTLYVDVDQPGWSTEIVFLSAQILGALEEQLGQSVALFLKPRVRGRSGVE